jgi:lysosomal Pro-X carboxypeptidase
VAASAPVAQFPAVPNFNPSAFWDVVTRDATPAAGAAPDCVDNTREAFRQLFEAGASAEGRQQLQGTFTLCDPLKDEDAVKQLAYWAQVGGSGA